jgi:hypothetical protein
MTPLRQRFIHDLRLRNRSPRTIQTYVHHLKEFARFFKTSPDRLTPEHARRYLLHVVHEKRVLVGVQPGGLCPAFLLSGNLSQ